MKRHGWLYLILVCTGIAGSVGSTAPGAGAGTKTDTGSRFIDTIPPIISASPASHHARSPLFVSLASNEKATIWYGVNSRDMVNRYQKSIVVSSPGRTVVYFTGEDMVGNRSRADSAVYTLDFQKPAISFSPRPGAYTKPQIVIVTTDEPCRLYFHPRYELADTARLRTDTIRIAKVFDGYISAIDMAGNVTTSDRIHYLIDTAAMTIRFSPEPGIFNRMIDVSLRAGGDEKVYYAVDPSTTRGFFQQYSQPISLEHGLTVVRSFLRKENGNESAIFDATYIIDTIAPKMRIVHTKGKAVDTVTFQLREDARVFYSLFKERPIDDRQRYNSPILIPRTGKGYVKAIAKDKAGNVSPLYEWEYRYDSLPPFAKASLKSGLYNKPLTITFTLSEPGTIVYTLDGTTPNRMSSTVQQSITISKVGTTVLRFKAVDLSDNISGEFVEEYTLDPVAPTVRISVEGDRESNRYRVKMEPSEESKIYYEIGDAEVTQASPIYGKPFFVDHGQRVRCIAVDNAGNRSIVYTLNDLQRPFVVSEPRGGIFNRRCDVQLRANIPARIYWRTSLTDTFVLYREPVKLHTEGTATLEYYAQADIGLRSSLGRDVYQLDWTIPRVALSMKQGLGDSVAVFFECSENATIYYTLDGSDPLTSKTTHSAGNKFTSSKDRISVLRSGQVRLAYMAEDLAGNRCRVAVLDITKPQVIPSVPAGPDRLYDRILSVTLGSYDEQSQIYYERHGKIPSMKSTLFSDPITVMASDTIVAFAVDASGFRGDMISFIYRIDLPPSPQFSMAAENAVVGRPVVFNASETVDLEDGDDKLTYTWDFHGDGTPDTVCRQTPHVIFTYVRGGRHLVSLTVTDLSNRSATTTQYLNVYGECPDGMVFIARERGMSFCIDVHEWPNRKGVMPLINVSWMRAVLFCHDEGKRLCTSQEWSYGCAPDSLGRQSASSQPVAVQKPAKMVLQAIGSSSTRANSLGIYDMVGNVWEWVADSDRGALKRSMAGGSYQSPTPSCNDRSEASMQSELEQTGFRCCK